MWQSFALSGDSRIFSEVPYPVQRALKTIVVVVTVSSFHASEWTERCDVIRHRYVFQFISSDSFSLVHPKLRHFLWRSTLRNYIYYLRFNHAKATWFPFSSPLPSLLFFFFLDAPSHLYKRVCPSVCPSVRPLTLRKNRRKPHIEPLWTHLIARPGLLEKSP